MKRLALVLVALFAFTASASSGHDEGHADGPKDDAAKAKETSEFILHHVADDTEFALEIPFPPYHLPAIDIAQPFGFLLIARTPGACDDLHHAPAGFEAFPSLGQFIHGCWDLRPTKAILMIWMAVGLLLVVLFLGKKRDQNGVPQGLLSHVVETLALFVRDEIAVPNIGKAEAPRYVPYLVSLFFFILAVNWLSLIPGMFAATGVITITTALAVFTFILTQIAGIRSAGLGGYLSHLTGGVPAFLWPIMIPVEIIGLFTKPFALLVRLFANMVAGHMVLFFLLALIFMLHPGAAVISVPMTAAIYLLEIFVGILQAYIFTLLTALFIGQGVQMGHHAHAHGADDHGPHGLDPSH
ncbi:MAG TPA: F0F1 ATP synthase subunit A [Archangium sp.]